jgi:flagellar motor switch protein FliN
MAVDMSQSTMKPDAAERSKGMFSAIPVTVEILLGTATMQLLDLMNLKPGSDLLLDQDIGEPVTVMVNGKKIARGELYVLETRGDLLGVRITEILQTDIT